MNSLYAISIITGEIFKIEEDDVKTLFKYQIPLKKKPNQSCKKCYGRGWVSTDPKNGLHYLCKCIEKCFMDGFKPTEITIELPHINK